MFLSLVRAAPEDRLAEARRILRSGDYGRVESIARALLDEAESPGGAGRQSLEAARAIDLLTASLVRAGKARAPETGELARRAVAIKEKALGPDHPDLAASVYGLAEQLRMAGAYPEARAAYERALAIRERAGGTDPAGLVESLRGLGTFHYKSAEYPSARGFYDRALAVAESALGPDHPDVALVLVDIARLLRTTGDFADGRPLLDRALAIQEKNLGPDHLETAYTLRELGEVLRLSGEYAAARPAFDRALAIRERVLGPDHLEVADVLTGLGILLRRTGILRDHTCFEAYPVCVRAEAIAERTLGPDHPELAGYIEGLGWATLQCAPIDGTEQQVLRERVDRAQHLFERSLSILEETFGPDHLACVDSLEGLAFSAVYHRPKDFSIEVRRRKLAILSRAFGPDNFDVGFTHMMLATTEIAWTFHVEPDRIPLLRKSALDDALEAERISREHARLTGRSLAEREALSVAASRWEGLRVALYLSTADSDPETRYRTLDSLVRSRAIVLDTIASRHAAILRATDPEVEHLARDMETKRARAANLSVRGSGAMERREYFAALENARRQEEAAERALAARSATFSADLERSRVGLDDVIASLPAGSALVAYAAYQDPIDELTHHYIAFVLPSGNRNPAAIELGAGDDIDRMVADWRSLVASAPAGTSSEAASRSAGVRLRRKIWDPVAKRLGGARRVFIVPDGALNSVSFAALPVEGGRYLVEAGPVLHYLSTERDLVPPKRVESGAGLLAVGGPAYDADGDAAPSGTADTLLAQKASAHPYRGARSSCESFQKMQFAPLPETEKEADRLVTLWHEARAGSSRALLGAEASEANFKRLAPGRRFVHIATHGFFLGGPCGENPLLLSGLALAGANHRAAAGPEEEDGILTAEEIAALDLSGVEWAVLSACDTASGDFLAGEGVLGLQRAFQIAGARTLVMSLWPVDDRATRRWMQELYEGRLRRGLDTADAVRAATLAVLSDRRRKGLGTDPFYWAGFIAAGDWH